MKYGSLTLGQIEAGINKIGGEEAFLRLLRGELEVREIVRPFQIEIWKTIKLGTGLQTGNDFRRDLYANGHLISNWAEGVLGEPQFTVAKEETEIDLTIISVKDLGFKQGTHLRNICKRAHELGLILCPDEAGPQLRLQYPDQPFNERLMIITGSNVFVVMADESDTWLHADSMDSNSFWDAGCMFVFALRGKARK